MRYKEGEGCWIVDVDPFTCTDIKVDGQYEVIVLAGGDIIDRSRASVGGTVSSTGDEEYHLYMHDGETVSLLSRSRIFLTHYPHNEDFDVIIKQLDGKTVKMLPNVGYRRD